MSSYLACCLSVITLVVLLFQNSLYVQLFGELSDGYYPHCYTVSVLTLCPALWQVVCYLLPSRWTLVLYCFNTNCTKASCLTVITLIANYISTYCKSSAFASYLLDVILFQYLLYVQLFGEVIALVDI